MSQPDPIRWERPGPGPGDRSIDGRAGEGCCLFACAALFKVLGGEASFGRRIPAEVGIISPPAWAPKAKGTDYFCFTVNNKIGSC